MDEKFILNKLLKKTEDSVILQISVPAESPYFDGHFPEFLLLPGVAQIDLIMQFARQYLGICAEVSEIKRVKFTNFILPSVPLILKLEKKENKIIFKIHSPGEDVTYSTGTLAIGGIKNGV